MHPCEHDNGGQPHHACYCKRPAPFCSGTGLRRPLASFLDHVVSAGARVVHAQNAVFRRMQITKQCAESVSTDPSHSNRQQPLQAPVTAEPHLGVWRAKGGLRGGTHGLRGLRRQAARQAFALRRRAGCQPCTAAAAPKAGRAVRPCNVQGAGSVNPMARYHMALQCPEGALEITRAQL